MGRQVVKMRADFDLDGKPVPLKFRYINGEEEVAVIKVDKITKRDTNNFAGNRMYVYFCESFLGNVALNYELRYEVDTCRWYYYF